MFNQASIIIASRNEGAMLRQTIEFIKRAPTNIPYEIIAVDDGSSDDSFEWLKTSADTIIRYEQTSGKGQGHGYARNKGARMASGNMLVFCDAHIDVEPYWLEEFVRVMEKYGADAVTPAFRELNHDNPLYSKINSPDPEYGSVGCGMTLWRLTETEWMYGHVSPFEAPILSGACWAVRSEAFWKVGGYEETFRGYGGDDAEISIKLWLNGFTLYATPNICVSHQFRIKAPYQVSWTDVMHNKLYIALCHYNDTRVERLLKEQSIFLMANKIYNEVFTTENIKRVRLPKFERRVHDDDWFFSRFNLNL
ncbi:MAG: glycosyltransferase [Eubacterium sp.]|nr:glycosyltransferase [Eubacterium sp.]